jgi:hypothetical protein
MNPLKKAGLISFMMLLSLFLACYIPLKISGLWDAGMNYENNLERADKLGILLKTDMERWVQVPAKETPFQKQMVAATEALIKDPELKNLFPGSVPPPVPILKDRKKIAQKFSTWATLVKSNPDSEAWSKQAYNFYFPWRTANRMFCAFAVADADQATDAEMMERLQVFLSARPVTRQARKYHPEEDLSHECFGLSLLAKWIENRYMDPGVIENASTILDNYSENNLAKSFLRKRLPRSLASIPTSMEMMSKFSTSGVKTPPAWQRKLATVPFITQGLKSKSLEAAMSFYRDATANSGDLDNYQKAFERTYKGYDPQNFVGYSVISSSYEYLEFELRFSVDAYRGRNTLIRMLLAAINAAKAHNSTGRFPQTIPVDPSVATTETDGSPISYTVSPDGKSLEISVPKIYERQVPVRGTSSTRKARMIWGSDLLGNPNRFVIKLGPNVR